MTTDDEADETGETDEDDEADETSQVDDEPTASDGEDDADSESAEVSEESRAVRGTIYRRGVSLARLGVVVLLAVFVIGLGTAMGYWVTTGGGDVTVESTTIETESGLDLGTTVYEPPNASTERPAPAVVLIHGYTGDRGTMESFAVEFAHRGYAVITVDQPGHGSSDPPAFEDGWGGPAALEYAHSLDIVDENRIALVGHSMGGFASLAAAKDRPDGHTSVVLAGSTWGPMDGVEGVPEANETFPQNMAVVYSPYDELSAQMWNKTVPGTLGESQKLATAFDADPPIEPLYWYGSFDTSTARMFTDPRTIHTGMHLSPTTIADTLAWVAATTGRPEDPATENQRWQWVLAGQGLAFVAGLVVATGTTALAWLSLSRRSERDQNYDESVGTDHEWGLDNEGFSRETRLVLTALPALTIYPLYALGTLLTPVTGLTSQELTHGFIFWALGTVALAAGLLRLARTDLRSVRSTLTSFRVTARSRSRESPSDRPKLSSLPSRLRSRLETQSPPRRTMRSATATAIAGVGSLYLLVSLSSLIPGSGFQFWMVGLDTLSPLRWVSALVYVVPFTAATVALSYGLARATTAKPLFPAIRHALVLTCGGLVVFLVLQYVPLFLGYGLPAPELGLLTLRALRATLLLAVATVVATTVTSLADSPLPGGLCAGLLVTWMVVGTEPLTVALF